MRRLSMAFLVVPTVLLSMSPLTAQCLGDFDADGTVRVNELVLAVNNALRGCRPTATLLTPTPIVVPTDTPTQPPPTTYSVDDECDFVSADDRDECQGDCNVSENECECEDRCDGCGLGLYCYPLVFVDGVPVLELGATCREHSPGCIIIVVPPTRTLPPSGAAGPESRVEQ
jgi:hypothetical protein